MGEKTPFPKRRESEVTYVLSRPYNKLFQDVYGFSRELVQSGEGLSRTRQRIRYWTASPYSAVLCRALLPPSPPFRPARRHSPASGAEDPDDSEYSPYVFESVEEETVDVQPAHIIETAKPTSRSERKRLRLFADLAAEIRGTDADTKVVQCARTVTDLLKAGFQPIVWSRYIATSDYVKDELHKRLLSTFPTLEVVSITGTSAKTSGARLSMPSTSTSPPRPLRHRLPERGCQPPGQIQRRDPLRPALESQPAGAA